MTPADVRGLESGKAIITQAHRVSAEYINSLPPTHTYVTDTKTWSYLDYLSLDWGVVGYTSAALLIMGISLLVFKSEFDPMPNIKSAGVTIGSILGTLFPGVHQWFGDDDSSPDGDGSTSSSISRDIITDDQRTSRSFTDSTSNHVSFVAPNSADSKGEESSYPYPNKIGRGTQSYNTSQTFAHISAVGQGVEATNITLPISPDASSSVSSSPVISDSSGTSTPRASNRSLPQPTTEIDINSEKVKQQIAHLAVHWEEIPKGQWDHMSMVNRPLFDAVLQERTKLLDFRPVIELRKNFIK